MAPNPFHWTVPHVGDSTISLGRWFQWLIVLTVNNCPLVSIWGVPRGHLFPLPFVFSLWLPVQSPSSLCDPASPGTQWQGAPSLHSQPDLTQVSQPFLTNSFPGLDPLCGLSGPPLLCPGILFLKWGPLDTIFQLWPDKCWEEGDNDFICAGKALVAAAQHHPGHSDLFTSLRDKVVYFTHKICPGNFFNPDCPFCVGCVCKFFLGERGVEPCPVFQVWAKQSITQSWNFHYLYSRNNFHYLYSIPRFIHGRV